MIFTFSFCSSTINQYRLFFFLQSCTGETLTVCPQTPPGKATFFFRQLAFFRIFLKIAMFMLQAETLFVLQWAHSGAGAHTQIFTGWEGQLTRKQTEGILLFLCALGSHGRGAERGHVCGHVAARGHQQRGPRHQLHTHRALQQVSVGWEMPRAGACLKQKND